MAKDKPARAPIEIAGASIAPGERRQIEIPISLLSNHTAMGFSVEIIHGRNAGPVLFISGALHGDEIIGVEIIRRLARSKALRKIAGTLLLIPIVNAYGFISHSRYLPDRRDLNRCFPGVATGSLGSQLAAKFMREIVACADYGVDLHSGALHRENLPQVRAEIADLKLRAMASAFGAPIILNAKLREGSLRQAAQQEGCRVLVYEASEALRYDERAVRIGLKGVFNIMRHLGMLAPSKHAPRPRSSIFSQSSHWLRAPVGGVMRAFKAPGEQVREGEVLAVVSDPFGENEHEVAARSDGVVIGRLNLPVVNRGDALLHIARVFDPDRAGARIEKLGQDIEDDPAFDDAGII